MSNEHAPSPSRDLVKQAAAVCVPSRGFAPAGLHGTCTIQHRALPSSLLPLTVPIRGWPRGQIPFPIFRALSIILTKRCEVCDEKRVRYLKSDFRVFAHDKCFEANLR